MHEGLLLSGLLLGIVSSFHCVGMCGPIALSLPVQLLPSEKKIAGIFLYNFGRIITYALLGFVFGFLGRQFFLGGFQQILSIVLGAVLIGYFFLNLGKRNWRTHAFANTLTNKLQALIAKFLKEKSLPAMMGLGAANGLLPCGMVYLAIASALADGTIHGGVYYMIAFGLGTFPAMFALSYFGTRIGLNARNNMKKAVPYVVLFMGILLMLRGLNLGIPYLSPIIENRNSQLVPCH